MAEINEKFNWIASNLFQWSSFLGEFNNIHYVRLIYLTNEFFSTFFISFRLWSQSRFNCFVDRAEYHSLNGALHVVQSGFFLFEQKLHTELAENTWKVLLSSGTNPRSSVILHLHNCLPLKVKWLIVFIRILHLALAESVLVPDASKLDINWPMLPAYSTGFFGI